MRESVREGLSEALGPPMRRPRGRPSHDGSYQVRLALEEPVDAEDAWWLGDGGWAGRGELRPVVCQRCRAPSRARGEGWVCPREVCGGRLFFPPVPAPLVFSIRKRFLTMFLAGTKRWEFRTRRPDVRRGEHHLVYESRGAGMIVAEMRIGRVITGTPDEVWEAVGHAGGVTREFFDRYFSWPDGHPRAGQMRGEACAIEMFPRELARPVPLPSTMRAPQSWARWKGQWPLPD